MIYIIEIINRIQIKINLNDFVKTYATVTFKKAKFHSTSTMKHKGI